MGRRKYPLDLLEEVEILDVAAEGKSLARINGLVLFVTGAVPGDVADIQLTRKKRSFLEGYPVKFHKLSDKRAEPFCEHFGLCGGCKWQHLDYQEQLAYKQKQVTDNLERLGKVELPEIKPILASEKTRFYRNKLEFSFTNRFWLTNEQIKAGEEFPHRNALGFHVPGGFDRVINIEKCHLQPDPSNAIRLSIRDYALEHGLEFFDLRAQTGLLRNIIIRTTTKGEVLLIVVFFKEEKEQRLGLLEHLKDNPEITSLFYIINSKKNDSIADQDPILFHGQDHLLEEMEDLKFKIGPKSFYQTNPEQAYELYKVVREMAGLTGKEKVYDLYTGTGTIALFVARETAEITGIEYIPEAIEDAKENARINGIENARFLAGDMKDILTPEWVAKEGHPDVVITDPPRAGMHADVIETLKIAGAKKIVYVSCNPATQARDLGLLDDDYRVEAVQPVDMFPHTHHVENVVLLVKRDQ